MKVQASGGVRYTVPEIIRPKKVEKEVTLRFRVREVKKNCYVSVYLDGERVIHKRRPVVSPGEMESITLTKEQLAAYPDCSQVVVCLEEK